MSSPTNTPSNIPDHRLIIKEVAPFFLGTIVGYFLWGIQVAQTYYYYRTYREIDTLSMKLVVVTVFMLDLFQGCTAGAVGWRFLVDLWGDSRLSSSGIGFWSNIYYFTHTLVAACVHCFYAHKIWALYAGLSRYILSSIVITLAVSQVVIGIGLTVLLFSSHIALQAINREGHWVVIGATAGAVTDIIIVILMTHKLNQMRTGLKAVDDIITKLIRIILETGLATAVVQLVYLVMRLVRPHEYYYFVPISILPKTYSNSMLALLNSRDSYESRAPENNTGPTIEVNSNQEEYCLQSTHSTGHGQKRRPRRGSV